MTVEYRIISIGTMSHNRLWGEATAVRTPHATTTLVTDGERRILVDPSLPGEILGARFHERTGQDLASVTDVFCSTLRPVHRRGLVALGHATWWCGEAELEAYGRHLEGLLDSAERLSSDDARGVRDDLELLRQFRPAPDEFGPQLSLFPLAGASAGSVGLLLTPPAMTVLVAGDAVVTGDHLAAGQVWQGCFDTEAALESLQDMLEVADLIIPGHDNLAFTPRRWF